MSLNSIWIKAVAFIVLSILAFASGIYSYRELNWKQLDVIFCSVISIGLMIVGLVNVSHAIKPDIDTIKVKYIYQSKQGIVFGREYHFVDAEGNYYDLTMDPITYRKIFSGQDFYEDETYSITYEKKSDTIVGIKSKSGDG